MVISHLRRVEHLLRFLQFLLSSQRLHQFCIRSLTGKASLEESVQDLWTLRIDIVWQECCIYTWVGSQFLLIELLDEVERCLGRETKLAITLHL